MKYEYQECTYVAFYRFLLTRVHFYNAAKDDKDQAINTILFCFVVIYRRTHDNVNKQI